MERRKYFEVVLVAAVFVMFMETTGCKRKPESSEKAPVSIGDIKIRYPDVQEQKRRMEKFSTFVRQPEVVKDPDGLLRRMVEEIPLEYVASRLDMMLQEPSADSKPNIAILHARISDMRSLNKDKASSFIQKLKEEKDVNGLCVSLAALRTEPMQAKAAEALASLGDPTATKVLTIQLVGASALYIGGTEARIYREQLRRSLVEALGSCTGLDFSGYDPSSESASLKVVKQCEDWLEERRN